ncbi:MAG: redoxin domain-containing protein [Fulvivirga sp.]|nr:redoxin domain-containing protein [Fulvivirga sp.]
MTIAVGETAPNFTLQNTEGNPVELHSYLNGHKGLILFFPLAFTSTCTEELCTVRDNMKLYNSLNAKVIAISVDSFFTLNEFKKAQNLNFTLLSDFNKDVSEMYGALYKDYFGMQGVSKRAAFVIGEGKEIKYAEVLEDSGKIPSFKSIQKALN